MTIDETIKRVEEISEKQEKLAKEWHENQVRKCELIPFAEMDFTYENECNECAEEHRQLAEWLKDYKRLLDQEPCEDNINRQSVIKEIHRLWNSGGDKDYCMETLRDFVSELPPVTSIHEKLKCTPKETTHEERVLIELTRDMPNEMGVLYIQSFQQEHGPFTDEAAEIIRKYLSKE